MMVRENIPTGCDGLDRILRGGLPTKSVTLVYGEPETGKTTLAIQCAVNTARLGLKSLFIDCDDTFSARRLSQIASEDYRQIAELIILMKPVDFSGQAAAIDQLATFVSKNFGLIIIDTITSLYGARIAEIPSKGFDLNRELNRQAALLAQIAKTLKIVILMTSQVRSVFDETHVGVEPVARRVLKFWADEIIALKPEGVVPQKLIGVLEKHRGKSSSFFCRLKIRETGIQSV